MPPSSVIAKVYGGLGNQMFQYAAGRALSTRLELPLELDVREMGREGASHQGYEIERVFRVQVRAATGPAVHRMLGWRSLHSARRVLRKMRLDVLNGRYVPEPHFHYWSAFERIAGPCYLDGYWQSYRYFDAIDPLLRTDFSFRNALCGDNLRVHDAIAASPASVSVHIRRGDYLSNSKAAAHHGFAGLAYYTAAVASVASRLPKPRFFVFSDDIAWARGNLPLPADTVFVDHNAGADSHFDLQLMSRCRHHIIANSSFSWWAAWLNPSPSKIVVAPSRWVLTRYDTTTITPPAWERI
jgi:hypothetical protein